ncbi:MAG: ABC transporter substrate-binding protein [Gemmobacter sp.]|uniref:extracellular solute-binding protein n=1 Tax=Gemmobacter sp. TaxID=1898957 RepID=UPI001A5FFF80|nr:extracellular solute-binding protein [Gemmobacter sp.]MBL8562671.1 ABC transporter substrate-binding protein [Gemmobacter sp.]
MRPDFFVRLRATGALVSLLGLALPAWADSPQPSISMYGAPALPPDFVSLPYANPEAPKGGRFVIGANGSFDSLNPYIVAGKAPDQITPFTVETLMGRSLDEPFSLYGLLAESITTDDARSYAEFTLRPEARFADGSPVTPEDVIWSVETLGTLGQPRYATAWKKVAKAEITGPRSVRFTFNTADRELPLLLGLRPILKKAQWQGKAFDKAGLEAPIGSGPYVVDQAEPGRFVSFRKNPDWWGKDLPFNRGLHNFDEIRVEYFGTDIGLFEAFKGGLLSSYRETNPAKWQTNFDFPAVRAGEIVKAEIAHGRPSGIEGFAFNTRNPLFADWRVREALILAFNFELVNQTLNGGAHPRISSYFGNSPLGLTPGLPAEGRVAALLAPFKDQLSPGALEGYKLPVADGEANRKNLRRAMALLEEAGWTITEGTLTNAEGKPFRFEILLTIGQNEMISAANIYVEALKRLGITAQITTLDDVQYKERTTNYQFDMTHYIRSLSLSPGNEQTLYWGAKGVTEPGTRNWPGINSPAAEAMIAALLATTDPAEMRAAAEALDRVLTSGRYVVPVWYSKVSRLAYRRDFAYPEKTPLYGEVPGWQPETWWAVK